ncbi:MAG: alpha/beta fold hydrolase [Myxococcaceae bacterium]
MRSLFADLNGPVHYLDFGGEGRPLVLVHGLGGSALNWQALGPLLTRQGRVIAVDLAGFGRTPLAGRQADIASNRDLLDAFLQTVVGEPALLFGNSMGGLLALLQAAQNPSSVDGLVLVSPAVPLPLLGKQPDPRVLALFALYSLPYLGEKFVELHVRRRGAESLVNDMFALCCVDAGKISREILESHLALARERAEKMPWSHGAFIAAAKSVVRSALWQAPFRAHLSRITAPTLIVHGEKDRFVPVSSTRRLVKTRPDFLLKVLPEVGHMAQLEAPVETLALVEEWLRVSGLGGERRTRDQRGAEGVARA